jgi:hypothetical protein
MNNQYGNVINNLDRMKVLKERPDCNSNGKNICANEAERMAETTGEQFGGISNETVGVEGTGEAEAGVDSEGESAETPEQNPGDARHMRKMNDPCLPTKSEIEEHRLTHLPFRNWCPFCVKGRGVERGHFRSERDADAVGEVHIDYCFPRGAGEKGRDIREKAAEATGNMTVMVLRERDTRMIMVSVVPRKGRRGNSQPIELQRFAEKLGMVVFL